MALTARTAHRKDLNAGPANPKLRMVIGAGLRTTADQDKAIKWGWSKTRDSEHMDGSAMDVWVLDDHGRVTFDPIRQKAVGEALKKAAAELGVKLRWGTHLRPTPCAAAARLPPVAPAAFPLRSALHGAGGGVVTWL